MSHAVMGTMSPFTSRKIEVSHWPSAAVTPNSRMTLGRAGDMTSWLSKVIKPPEMMIAIIKKFFFESLFFVVPCSMMLLIVPYLMNCFKRAGIAAPLRSSQ
jgi:hypothetical protein